MNEQVTYPKPTFEFKGMPSVLYSHIVKMDGLPQFAKYLSSATIALWPISTQLVSKLNEKLSEGRNTAIEDNLYVERGLAAERYSIGHGLGLVRNTDDHILLSLGTKNSGVISGFKPESPSGIDILRIRFTKDFYQSYLDGEITQEYAREIRKGITENMNYLLGLVEYDMNESAEDWYDQLINARTQHVLSGKLTPKIYNNNLVQDGMLTIEFSFSYFQNIPREDIMNIFNLIFGDLQDKEIVSEVPHDSKLQGHPAPLEDGKDYRRALLYYKYKWVR